MHCLGALGCPGRPPPGLPLPPPPPHWVCAAHTHARSPRSYKGRPRGPTAGQGEKAAEGIQLQEHFTQGQASKNPMVSVLFWTCVLKKIKETEKGLVSAADQEPPGYPQRREPGGQPLGF